jgi:hypothetical protein
MVKSLEQRIASVVGELSSGFDATTAQGVNDYDPEKTQGQFGLDHEQEVAKQNNWETPSDKRDVIGKPMPREVKAAVISRLKGVIDKIAQLDDEKSYEKEVKDSTDDQDIKKMDTEEIILNIAKKEGKGMLTRANVIQASKLLKQAAEILADGAADEDEVKVARHPSEPRDDAAYTDTTGSPQMGDDEWVDIGPGTFDDQRTVVHTPA